jgi:hypothetical protein
MIFSVTADGKKLIISIQDSGEMIYGRIAGYDYIVFSWPACHDVELFIKVKMIFPSIFNF